MKNTDITGNVQSPEELADLIDALMEDGTGHINVTADPGKGLTVKTVNSTDCGVKGACCQPTEESDDND